MDEQKKLNAEEMAALLEKMKEKNAAYMRGRAEGEEEAIRYMRREMGQEESA